MPARHTGYVVHCTAPSTSPTPFLFDLCIELADWMQELQVHRTWSVDRHPEWLVFEAEGQLQIRPVQRSMAQFLIDNPGKIAQLNMGEGKTRVILPMLILHSADGQTLVSGDSVWPPLQAAQVLGHQSWTLRSWESCY
jgi:hypothetical protein